MAKALVAFGAAVLLAGVAHAQGTPASNPYDQTRTSSFTYFDTGAKNGLLKTETVEPDNAQLCVTTTYDYDAYGNRYVASTANCAGATGAAIFPARSASSAYGGFTAQVNTTTVTVPAGAFATTSSNALNQSEIKTYDPRFGAVVALTGPNGLTTQWAVDDFGRKVRETRADGTSSVFFYCFVSGVFSDPNYANSQSTNCPTPSAAEVPAGAYSFVHTEPRDTANQKSGPFSRIYSDRAGRSIRSVTEAFDGANQAGGTARLIVQDTDYSPYGPQIVATQPYFLDTGSSLANGSAHYGMSRTEYDTLGRPIAVYVTDAAATINNGSVGNQGSGRPAIDFGNNRGAYQSAVTTLSYSGLTTTTVNDKNQTRIEEKNVDGKLVRATDALGAQVAYQHDAFGNLVVTKDALQNQLVVSYDPRGRKVAMTDPDTGLWQYDYDALGQLIWQQSPNQRAQGQTTTMVYDVLGRMTQRTEPEYVGTWSYDKYANNSVCTKGIGKLCESNTTNGVNKKVGYDGLGRPINSRTTIANGPSFGSALAYESATGRLVSQIYPTGLQVNYAYTAKGFVSQLTLGTTAAVNPLPANSGGSSPGPGPTLNAGAVLWQAVSYNAWGRAEQQQYGNGVNARASFDALTGRLTQLSAGLGSATDVMSHGYLWDSLGHLTQRSDAIGDGSSGPVGDSFGYDALGRLQSYQVSSSTIPNIARSVTLQYNALGMLLYKSDVGNYAYGTQNTAGVKPHALVSVTGTSTTRYAYDANGNLTSADGGKYRSIAYTSFNLPDSSAGAQGPGGSPKYTWQYDENHQRIKETQVASAGTRTTWNLHPDNVGGLGFESESSTASPTPMNRHYLSVGGTAIGVLVSRGALPPLAAGQMAPATLTSITLIKAEYWHKDHLGSLIATTDHTGAVTARYSYDPFGKRRQASGTYDSFGALIVDWTTDTNKGTDRGYTGHEHLDDIGVIHMNGRIFDPTLGKFMQGDPLIQDPGNLQNYDRYAYCYNNPLTCSDPSGFNSFTSFQRIFDPGHYWGGTKLAKSQIGLVVLNVMLAYGSSWCTPFWYASCYGVGQATIASYQGYSNTQALRAGVIAGASAYAYQQVGNWTTTANPDVSGEYLPRTDGQTFANVAGHAAVGCASAAASGGSCQGGAVGAGLSAAWAGSNYGPTFSGDAGKVIGLVSSAVIGGLGSIAGGGAFADGARQAAYGYIFNELIHETSCVQQGYCSKYYREDGTICPAGGSCYGGDAPAKPSDTFTLGPTFTYAAAFGGVAGFGIYINPGVGGSIFDFGIYTLSGPAYGVDMSVVVTAGYVKGNSTGLTGNSTTSNVGVSFGPAAGYSFTTDNGRTVGKAFNFGIRDFGLPGGSFTVTPTRGCTISLVTGKTSC